MHGKRPKQHLADVKTIPEGVLTHAPFDPLVFPLMEPVSTAHKNGGPAERDFQQRQLLEHRHRRQGRHPDLQRRRRADAGLHGRRGDEQDHAGRHFRSAGSDRARQSAERRARNPDYARLRGVGVQGLARDRGHLRADLLPQGWEPVPGGGVRHGAARRAGRHHRLSADRHRAQGGGPAERDFQQRQLLEHRHRREGRHPDLQRRRRADAGLHGRRGDEQDHAGRHFRSAGSDRARQSAERRARNPDYARLRGPGVQGLARDRGHLRADLHPQGWEPVPGGGVRHGAARRAGRHHRLSADRHRQHRAQAGGRGAAQGGGPAERDFQQRQLLEHRHRREGRHPDLQRRRRADAGLHGRRGDEQDHAGRHFRSAGSDRARQSAERRARNPDYARLRGLGVQGLARDRGHLRADLHPQGWEPVPGGGVRHGAARRAGRHHRLSADRHRAQGGGPAERDFQQRQLLEHRHRREGRHSDLQRRRRADAGLHGRRGDEQDHAGRHFRSAGSDRARQSAERRARNPDYAGLSKPWCSRPRAGSRTSTS